MPCKIIGTYTPWASYFTHAQLECVLIDIGSSSNALGIDIMRRRLENRIRSVCADTVQGLLHWFSLLNVQQSYGLTLICPSSSWDSEAIRVTVTPFCLDDNDPVKAVQIEPVDTEGNNFSSVCERVTVTFQNGRPNLMLFSKRQLPSEGARKEMGNIQAYVKEDFFFSKLLPDLLQFAHEKATYNGFLEHIFPKCYHTDENLLVLANLHCAGYRMLEEKDRYHNLEHGRVALDRLARFHAATYALIQSLGQEGFKSKYPFVHSKNNWSEEGETTRGPWLQMVIDGALKVLREKPTAGSEKALEYFEQFQTRGFLMLTHHFNPENPSCAIVVNHGDYWNANMMFRNGIEGNKQKDCVIVDWQTIHLGSPALDVQLYLFLVVNTEERVKEWMNLLQFYYERFEGYTEQLGQPTLFSFEELVQDFRRRCEPGFIMGMYNVFGITALTLPPDGSGPSMEENILDYLAKAMVFGLDKLMETRGEEFSKGIVRDFEEFQRVRLNE